MNRRLKTGEWVEIKKGKLLLSLSRIKIENSTLNQLYCIIEETVRKNQNFLNKIWGDNIWITFYVKQNLLIAATC